MGCLAIHLIPSLGNHSRCLFKQKNQLLINYNIHTHTYIYIMFLVGLAFNINNL
jgi:hypothetical protein